jgi:threonine synthase
MAAVSPFVTNLECSVCGRELDHRRPQNLCPCGGPLLVEYDLTAVRRAVSRRELAYRPADMWRYRELLPVDHREAQVTLGEGFTPLLPSSRLGARIGLTDLWIKDDGVNPTGTFKSRGAACGVSRAVELGISKVALPTAGNAGGAWACYGAAAGLAVHVVMPEDAPASNRQECQAYGARVTLVKGLISDAGRAAEDLVEREGWFDVSTLKEPYRIEGKKTLGLEIAEQLGWRMPDAIAYPAGGGVGIIGIWRGLQQLRDLGWTGGGLPRLIVVQSEGCAPIVRAFEEGAEESRTWEGAETIAAGLRVPKPLGDRLTLRAIRETGGTAVAVSDEAILQAMTVMAREGGILACPEGAATFAGAGVLRERGDLVAEDRVVLINTGTGLKYPEAMEAATRRALL